MFSSLLLVLLIGAIAWAGASAGLAPLFGVALPYVAVVVFIAGMVWRMVYWAKSPVPFCIPTTGGQEQSLDFIKQNKIDCPSTTWGVVKRMFLEVFFFRSLFRNSLADVRENDPISNGPRSVYYSSKWLWCFALLFHYCFLLIFIRHFRFFIEPVPSCITFLESIDGIMQVGSPRFYWTGGLVLVALLSCCAAAFSTTACAISPCSTTTSRSGCSSASWARASACVILIKPKSPRSRSSSWASRTSRPWRPQASTPCSSCT